MNIKLVSAFLVLAFAQFSLADVTFTHAGAIENETGTLVSGDTYTHPATNLWLSNSNQRIEITQTTTFVKSNVSSVGGKLPNYQVLVFSSSSDNTILRATGSLGGDEHNNNGNVATPVNDISLTVNSGEWIAIRSIWKNGGGQTSVSVVLEENTSVETDSIAITGMGTMDVGDTVQFSATVLPAEASNKNFFWGTTTSDILFVDLLGKVTALKSGEGIVTATQGSDVYTFSVTVNDTSTGGGVSNWILNSNAQNQVVVYDLQGKLIAKMSEAKWNNTFSVQTESQLYLVRVYSHSGALLSNYKTLK